MTAHAIRHRAAHGNDPTRLLDIDALAKIGSAVALGTAVLAAAGILSVVAYLSAWSIPGPLIRLDPLTAALRSESVLYQFAMLGLIVFGLDALAHRVGHRRRVAIVGATGLAVVLSLLVIDLVVGGYLGPLMTIGGGLALAVAHHRGTVGPRATAVLFAAIALAAASMTGAESGRLIRDDPTWQTPVTLTSRTAVGGLAGGVETSGAWQYDGLYLVFRDGEAVYVSRPGAGATVWIVPAMHVMALGVGS